MKNEQEQQDHFPDSKLEFMRLKKILKRMPSGVFIWSLHLPAA